MIHAVFGDTIAQRSPVPSRLADLLRQYFRIAFLMGKPQDLPGGSVQMRTGLALALFTYLVALVGTDSLSRILVHVALDLGCTALIFHVGLSLVGHPGRFEQAFGGLCGASAFVNLAAWPIYHGGHRAEGPSAAGEVPVAGIAALGEFVLLVWSLSVLAHVLRHTFSLRMGVSVLAAFAYMITLVTLFSVLLPLDKATIDHPEEVVSSVEVKESRMV